MSEKQDQQRYVHSLGGCRPTPLASYLKALGVFRLIAEGPDSNIRGWWQNDVFHLGTRLSQAEIERFFLHNYSPTPLLAPWNGGSGFFPKDNKAAIEAIRNSRADRFQPYRDAILAASAAVAHIDEKPAKGTEKNGVIAACRRSWRGAALEWIDAALTFGADGEPAFPAMLGTGGNDGRLDFTNNFMQRLVTLFDLSDDIGTPMPESSNRLALALWATPIDGLESAAIGQFLPSSAGGPNGANGYDGGIKVNPWDFALMLEGCIVFSAGLARKCSASQLPQAAAPFAVRGSGTGYDSASAADVGARGEQWMPLWDHPSLYREVRTMLREGRCTVGKRPAGRGIDMARAIARLGVNRGISQFERYGYIERNGLSNLAVPLGRFDVHQRRFQRLLDEVSPWLDRLRQMAQDKLAPASIQRVYRSCEQAVFNCAQFARKSDFLDLLVAMAAAEDQFLASPKFSGDRAMPIPPLSEAWLSAVEEDSCEFRLAVALAGQFGRLKGDSKQSISQSVRVHWLPLANDQRKFLKSESGINITPEQCAVGLDLERGLIAMIGRRLMAMNRGESYDSQQPVPFYPLRLRFDYLGATWEHIAAFLNHETDDSRILQTARALMALRWPKSFEFTRQKTPRITDGSKAAFGILRLAVSPHAIRIRTEEHESEHEVRCNSMVFQRLIAGDLPGAFRLAQRQLLNAGLRSKMPLATGDAKYARRLAASLGFGLGFHTYSRLALTITDCDASEKPVTEHFV
ncbi:MAG TPA: type I-U CRISPR-associated protein Csx17 [Pirellulaceae bacterium]|nr:type I-U CRISPR-associated protein Csx17 [Pirellulaceae bacterium]HMO91014.1 type I-U CRISPR-associated protein Csx17 [Pirellulaceae bacterium]HMP68129.1 type I-U CRISPR-associated protein Csx17 [Pirellulaceae bacterium]